MKFSIVNFLTTTRCNAWDLKSVAGSPGVCRFCYRERERVQTDETRMRAVIERAVAQFGMQRLTLTGGEPLLSPLAVQAAEIAKSLGCEVHIHTNGLLLPDAYPRLRDVVDVFTLAIDGHNADLADWDRGQGYFARFEANLARIVADRRTVAFNTFVSPRTFPTLGELGKLIEGAAEHTMVDYWLVSQYRDVNRASEKKRSIYRFSREEFCERLRVVAEASARFMLFFTPAEYVAAKQRIENTPGRIVMFAQPSRADDDPYPLRMWLAADGNVTVDSGLAQGSAGRNVMVGNLLDDSPEELEQRLAAHSSPADEIQRRAPFRRPTST